MTFKDFFNHKHLLLEANPEKRIVFLTTKYSDQIRKFWEKTELTKYSTPEDIEEAINELVRGVVFHTDPTEGEYSEWILKNYLKLEVGYLNRWHEDNYKIHDDLVEYHKYKRLLKQDEELKEYTDINRIKSFQDLYRLVNSEDSSFGQQIAKAKEKEEQKEMEGQADKIYVSENYLIVVPKTQEASCSYGRNTRWCTASTGSYNYFDQYNKQGPLYIIIDKKQNEKYQFHFQSKQFMNSDDSQIDVKSFLKENEELQDIIFELAMQNDSIGFCIQNFKPEKVLEEVEKMPEEKQRIYIQTDVRICFHLGVKNPEFVNKQQRLFEFRGDNVMINTGEKEWSELTDFIRKSNYDRSNPRETAKEILEGEANWLHTMDSGATYDSEYLEWLTDAQQKQVFEYLNITYGEEVENIRQAATVIDENDDDYLKDLLTSCYDSAYNYALQGEYYEKATDAIESVICMTGAKQKHFRNANDEIVLIWTQRGVHSNIEDIFDTMRDDDDEPDIAANPSEFMVAWQECMDQNDGLGKVNFDNVWPDMDIKEHGEEFQQRFDMDFVMPKRLEVQPELELSSFAVNNSMKSLFDETIEQLLEDFANPGKGFNRGGNTPIQNPPATAIQNPAGVGNNVAKSPMKFQNTPGQMQPNVTQQGGQQNNQNQPMDIDPMEQDEFANALQSRAKNPQDFGKMSKTWDADKWNRFLNVAIPTA